MKTVGIIGTGMLGSSVASHLLDVGFRLIVFNRTREKTRKLEKKGAIVAESPKHVALESDLVITVVKDADAVRDVAFGENGIVKGKHEDLIVADMSTINPLESKKIADTYSTYGIPFLDTPVMGGPNVAINGELVVMIGGDKAVFDTAREVFEKIGKQVFYLGGNGTAHAVKLAMNLQIAMLALALSEGITLARAIKIDPKKFLDILNSTYFKTGMSENKAYKMIQDEFNPTFTLENLKKDISTINDTAKSFGLDLPMIKKAEEIYQDAINQGFGKIDYTGILAYFKKNYSAP